MMSKTYLCGFASNDLFLSKFRYLKQARKLDYYKKIFFYGPNDLSRETQIKINNYLKIGDRKIYGHGVWKPEIIYKSLFIYPRKQYKILYKGFFIYGIISDELLFKKQKY